MTERAIDRMVEYLEKHANDDTYEANIAGAFLTEARRLAQEEKSHKAEAPIGDEAQKRYYNECAKNSVLYDLASALITRLEYHDPNDPILEKAEDQLNGNGYSLGIPAEKSTAPASLVEYPCPTCGAERFKTERRPNGDSWCRYGHKHPTKDFVRPTPQADNARVVEIKTWLKEKIKMAKCYADTQYNMGRIEAFEQSLEEIIRKFGGAA